MIERIHLQVIKAVQDKGSLTAAAGELCVTQSALSHAIKKLEERLGTPVWIREGRSLLLTQAGRHLLSTAERTLPMLEYTEQSLNQIARGERGTLRIGMECHPCYQWLLKAVSPFLADWPLVDIDVKQKFQFGGVGALLNYDIDLLITPDPFYKESLEFEPVFKSELVLIVTNNHPLAERGSVEADDLRGETLYTYPVSVDRLDIFSKFLNPANALPKRHKTIETTDILLKMVESGRGVTALPYWLAHDYAKQLDIKLLRFGSQGIQQTIYLGTRKTDSEVAYINAFKILARSIHEQRSEEKPAIT